MYNKPSIHPQKTLSYFKCPVFALFFRSLSHKTHPLFQININGIILVNDDQQAISFINKSSEAAMELMPKSELIQLPYYMDMVWAVSFPKYLSCNVGIGAFAVPSELV